MRTEKWLSLCFHVLIEYERQPLQSCGDKQYLSSGTCNLDEPERTKHVNGDKRVFEALAANACIDSGTLQYQYSAVLHRLQSIPRESMAPTRHVTSARFKIIYNLVVIQEQG